MIAFSLVRPTYAKILIKAGADQTVRDKKGCNILHHLFCGVSSPSVERLDDFQKMLGLVDPSLVSSLLVERSSHGPGSLTPLAMWMMRALNTTNTYSVYGNGSNYEGDNQMETLRIILDFAQSTGQKHLELLNGAGNSVMHDAVRCQLLKTLEILFERRPDLLHRENASGLTPAEVAEAPGSLKLHPILLDGSGDTGSRTAVSMERALWIVDPNPSSRRMMKPQR